MRKALVTAFVIAGGFVGCAGTPPPAPAATHVVVGEASFAPVTFHPVVIVPGVDPGDGSDTDGVNVGPRNRCPPHSLTCIPQ